MKKRTYLLSMVTMSIFFIVLGVSYALFQSTSVGKKDLVFETGIFEVIFQEKGNVIQLGNAYPMTEQEGMKTEEYHFQVENRGGQLASYKISLEEDRTVTNPVSKNRLKIAWKKNNGSYTKPVFLSDLENLTIESGVGLASSKSDQYALRIWLDESATNEEQGRTFKAKIVVEATQIVSADQTLASAPELEDNMIPVKYDETTQNWIKADVTNPIDNPWYQYQNKMWANAVTVDQNKVMDLSGKNHSGTINGATLTSGEASFDGVDDYIDCGLKNYDFKNTITFILRFKPNAIENNTQEVFGNWEVAGGGISYNNHEIRFGLYSTEAKGYIVVNEEYRLQVGKYYTIVATYDGKQQSLYVNGEKIASITRTNMITPASTPVLLGANPQPNSKPIYQGNLTITDAVLFDRGVTEEEVIKNYSSTVQVEDKTDLLLHYDFRPVKEYEVNSLIPMDAINTMMVWIPRYKYVMPAKKEGQIDIVFENNKAKKASGGATGTSYLTHPAFTFGTTELNGLWVGKFESSSDIPCTALSSVQGTNCDLTTIHPQVKPNVKSWTGARVSTFFTAARNMQAAGNPYGYNQNGVDTHMIKNSEWGAVAYLMQSKYGRCTDGVCTEMTMNNLNSGDGRTITGCAADTIIAAELKQTDCPATNKYNTEKGVLASTTGNIYGIYDMSGGDWEYVMGSYNKYSGYTAISYTAEQAATILGRKDNTAIGVWNSGFNGPIYGKGLDGTITYTWTTGIDFPEEKYYDLYTTDNVSTGCNGKPCLGHALYETEGWYGDYHNHITPAIPWFYRGGAYHIRSDAGALGFDNGYGRAYAGIASRIVVSKE